MSQILTRIPTGKSDIFLVALVENGKWGFGRSLLSSDAYLYQRYEAWSKLILVMFESNLFLLQTSFGVCCLFVQTSCNEDGSIIQANNSYVSNPGFPAAYTSMESCTYNVVNQISGK